MDEDARNKETKKLEIFINLRIFSSMFFRFCKELVTAGDSEKTERAAFGLFVGKNFSSRVDEGCCSYASAFALRLSLPSTVLSANLVFLSSKFGNIFFYNSYHPDVQL